MKKRKLGIIGGSGLYKMEGFNKTNWKKVKTPWGKPSDEILIASLNNLCEIINLPESGPRDTISFSLKTLISLSGLFGSVSLVKTFIFFVTPSFVF